MSWTNNLIRIRVVEVPKKMLLKRRLYIVNAVLEASGGQALLL